MWITQRLHQRVIAVTGGAHRLGAEIVRVAANTGMRVAFSYHHSLPAAHALCAELQAQGHAVWAWHGDLSQPGMPAAFVDAVVAHYGTLDVLVNNAGIWRATPVADVAESDWDALFDLNVKATFHTIQHAIPVLRTQQGSVVNICDAGVYRPWRNYTPYLASKGALVTMTTALARELAPHIRVNGVAPGLVLPAADWDDARIQQVVNAIPLKRVGRATDIAEAVLYLASAPYITGCMLPVDGGLTR